MMYFTKLCRETVIVILKELQRLVMACALLDKSPLSSSRIVDQLYDSRNDRAADQRGFDRGDPDTFCSYRQSRHNATRWTSYPPPRQKCQTLATFDFNVMLIGVQREKGRTSRILYCHVGRNQRNKKMLCYLMVREGKTWNPHRRWPRLSKRSLPLLRSSTDRSKKSKIPMKRHDFHV